MCPSPLFLSQCLGLRLVRCRDGCGSLCARRVAGGHVIVSHGYRITGTRTYPADFVITDGYGVGIPCHTFGDILVTPSGLCAKDFTMVNGLQIGGEGSQFPPFRLTYKAHLGKERDDVEAVSAVPVESRAWQQPTLPLDAPKRRRAHGGAICVLP